ncbi:MAG: demethoxyubiquinone hydroxylase family protein [Rickettsiaceae bacterium]|nr:demethoxyubiquinone hydroxylase family protein [Rickettsiaceae bacterium]
MPRPYFVENNAKNIERIIRVNHAGEFAAKNIYACQIPNITSTEIRNLVEEMYHQELGHLKYYQELMFERNIRPSVFLPLWGVLSKTLGYLTSFSPNQIMLCTKAVEEVIENHYRKQENLLETQAYDNENELLQNIRQHLSDEVHHKNMAEKYITFSVLNLFSSCIIKLGCVGAIKISKHF